MKFAHEGKIGYLQPTWAEHCGIRAGFTGRNGGVSRVPFNSLNLGYNTDDLAVNVEGNRSTLTRAFGLRPHQLLTVNQVHGSDVLLVNEPNPDLSYFLSVACDAVVTDQPKIMVGILTADCYPVLLVDPQRKVAGVVHVGWRGAAYGLIEKTIQVMHAEYGCQPEQLLAAVGPGIGAHAYEVDRPVRDAFRHGAGRWDEISAEVALGKWHLDLRRCCELQLNAAGLLPHKIEIARECTCCHRETLFSHRRDKGQTGRQLGFVLID